jgi:hypothetical protein
MTPYIRDLIKYILIGAAIFGALFWAGFLTGRARPPEIKTILMEDAADREYIERYRKAGTDEYEFILHKEYKLDAEFVTPF